MTSQDLVHGIDVTALTRVSGSEINQEVDAGRLAADKGMRIITYDIALNVPEVPNPNVLLQGVTPTWWTRYKWVRKPFDSTGIIVEYNWSDYTNSDPTFLQWVATNVDTTGLQTDVAALQVTVGNQQAEINANTANIGVNTTNIAGNTGDISDLNNVIASAIANVNTLVATICPPGTLRLDASSGATSGWLLCDGSSLLRSDYANLYARIGSTYGAVDSTHFNLPDIRGRSLVMFGQGTGLSLRSMGQVFGEETHLLTGDETGVKAHNHNVPGLHHKTDGVGFNIGGSHVVTTDVVDPALVLTSDNNTASNADQPHNNMSPVIVVAMWIKT